MCGEYKSAGFVKRCVKLNNIEKMEQQQKQQQTITSDCYEIVLFEQLFCILFDLFDKLWTSHLGTSQDKQLYFEFGKIMNEMKKTVDNILKKNIPDYSLFQYFLNDL
jgi:hypothetical protein